jgi:hypothetical protein
LDHYQAASSTEDPVGRRVVLRHGGIYRGQDNRPALRVCPWDQLLETCKALAPIAGSSRKKTTHEITKQPIRFDSESFGSMGEMRDAIVDVELEAACLLGGALNEIEYGCTITDDRYEEEWDETHQQVMQRLEQKIAEFKRERDFKEAAP